MMILLTYVTLMIMVSGCTAAETNYRGVPDVKSEKMSPHAKQLVIDQSFENEIGSEQ